MTYIVLKAYLQKIKEIMLKSKHSPFVTPTLNPGVNWGIIIHIAIPS